ncbi:class I SAM-dependent methyltransferase [Thiovibrio sp. JS02]
MNNASPPPLETVARFDKAAASWEENPMRVALAAGITETLRENIPLTATMQVLEYGCGTGMISRAISPLVRSVTGVDTSSRMLAVFEEKAREEKCANITATHLDLSKQPGPGESFDLIISSMTLHHIVDIETVIKRFLACLRPGGYLAVADLAPEDGGFHDDNTGVAHYGIAPETLMNLYEQYGGIRPASRQAHLVQKKERCYPVLFTWCQKK